MKIYVVEATCAVCGGEGVATPSVAASEWFGHKLIHTDPLICEENLREEREKEKVQQEKQSPEQPTAPKD